MNTWPDFWYHTSQDSPDKLDPTQLKRSVVLTAAAAYTIATADDAAAAQIAAEIVSNAAGRIGHQLARGVEEVKRADADSLASATRKARGYVEASALNERSTLDSVLELATDKASLKAHLETLKDSVRAIERGALATIDAHTKAVARKHGVTLPKPVLSPLEKKAAAILPRPTPKIRESGYRGYQEAITKASGQQVARTLRGSAAEIQLLCDGKTSALDIKKMLDTEFRQETSLQTVLDYLEVLKKAGLIVY
jgi:hypothetical protein